MARFYKATIYSTNWVGRPRNEKDRAEIAKVIGRATAKGYTTNLTEHGTIVITGSKSSQSLCNLFKGTGSTFHLSSYGIGPCDVLIELDRQATQTDKPRYAGCNAHRNPAHVLGSICDAYEAGLAGIESAY